MNWRILAIGKPKLAYAKAGIEEYAKRLRPFADVTLEYLKGGVREAESRLLLERSEGMFRIVMDERGEGIGSRALAAKVTTLELARVKTVALLIGGADGHSPEVRTAADWQWSLSALTLQHELALVVVMEQIYRAYSIKLGMPYQRD